ncbi:MAG: ABC transporter permease [Bacteroidota bacterium]|nr:ABC transporter permease [Bacteroidota bacterium]
MKILFVIQKSFKEQIRSYWLLLLTVFMAPFFVFIYYMMSHVTEVHYDIVVVNQDKGFESSSSTFNHGDFLVDLISQAGIDSLEIPLRVKVLKSRKEAEKKLKNKKADALLVLPEDFSERIGNVILNPGSRSIQVDFSGDLTSISYMVSAIWTNEILNEYLVEITGMKRLVTIVEIPLGISGKVNDFDLWVPGLLILSIIMLMFTATIAIVAEVENKTIIRLRFSRVTTFELLSGIGLVQIGVGLVSIILTLLVAVLLGFEYVRSLGLFILIAVLTAISIISFSLILAGATKSVNEVLIVGNFPLFIFMFFSGAAFPIKAKELFSIAGYPISWQSLMSPSHAISALNKIWIMGMDFKDIMPELIALLLISILYFLIGAWLFNYRHMRVLK